MKWNHLHFLQKIPPNGSKTLPKRWPSPPDNPRPHPSHATSSHSLAMATGDVKDPPTQLEARVGGCPRPSPTPVGVGQISVAAKCGCNVAVSCFVSPFHIRPLFHCLLQFLSWHKMKGLCVRGLYSHITEKKSIPTLQNTAPRLPRNGQRTWLVQLTHVNCSWQLPPPKAPQNAMTVN